MCVLLNSYVAGHLGYYYFVDAFIAFHLFCRPPSESIIRGHSFTICDIVCAIALSHLLEDTRPHLCIFAAWGHWLVQKRFSAHHMTPNYHQPPQFLHFMLPFIFGDFKVGMMVDHSKSQPMDDKPSLKGLWSHHMTDFEFVGPLKYPLNGQS